MPMDPDVLKTGIASHKGAFPILEPAEMRGAGIVSQRYAIPGFEDVVWEYSADTRRLRRLPIGELSDAFGVASHDGVRPELRWVAGRDVLRVYLGSRFRVWFFSKNPGLHLPSARRATDARVGRG